MPLELADPAWSKLPGSYGHSRDIVTWLNEAKIDGRISDERLGDLVNEVAHQGDGSLAIYGVVPYLIEFAQSASSQAERVRLLTHAGLLCADLSRAALEDPDEDAVITQYDSAKSQGAQMLSPLLVELSDFNDFQYGVAALAGFLDKWEIARVLETLELFEGKLHHPWFERPVFPYE